MAADKTTANLRNRDTTHTAKRAMAKSEGQALPTAASRSASAPGRPIKRIGALLVLSAVILGSVFKPDLLLGLQLPTRLTHCFHSQSIESRVERILSNTPLIGMK
jgi:membrane dipeptidase